MLFAYSSFSLLLMLLLTEGGMLELKALNDPGAARWRTARRANTEEPVVQFDDEQAPVLISLGLFRDGVLPIEPGS